LCFPLKNLFFPQSNNGILLAAAGRVRSSSRGIIPRHYRVIFAGNPFHRVEVKKEKKVLILKLFFL
jgi:hypothetical protein